MRSPCCPDFKSLAFYQQSLQTRVQKNKQFAVGFPSFWEVRSMIFCYFGSSGTHIGGPGAHFEDFEDFYDFRGVCDGNSPPLEVKSLPLTYFLQGCVFHVFSHALFSWFLWFRVPGDSILATIWTTFGEPWASGKTAESVQLSSCLGIWPLPVRVFLQVSTVGAFWGCGFITVSDF